MSTLPVVAFAMPAAISATIVASCDDEKVNAARLPGSRSSVSGPARAVALAKEASLMRKSDIAARAFHALRQLHYFVLSNTAVAQKLLEIRTLMELAGESFYKYSAYEKA